MIRHGLSIGRTLANVAAIIVCALADRLHPPAPVHGYDSDRFYADN